MPDTPGKPASSDSSSPAIKQALDAGKIDETSAGPLSSQLAEASKMPSVVQSFEASLHTGPLPPAVELGAYEREIPGSAQWIMQQAEREAEHIREMERGALRIAERDSALRIVVPSVTVVAALVVSGAISIFSSKIGGATAFAATITSVLVAYLTSQRDRRGDEARGRGPGGN